MLKLYGIWTLMKYENFSKSMKKDEAKEGTKEAKKSVQNEKIYYGRCSSRISFRLISCKYFVITLFGINKIKFTFMNS